MWIAIGTLLILGLLLIYLYYQNSKLQRKVDLLEPMLETTENIRDILYYCETTPKLHYRYLSPAINEFLGPNALEEHLENPEIIYEITHPDDRETLMNKQLGKLNFDNPIIVRFKNQLGEYIWFEEYATPIYNGEKFIAVQGLFRNIHDKVLLQQRLEYESTHDELTGLYNRAFFQAKMKEYNESHVPIAIIVADLDDLKKINDEYGHQMGDQLIREAANCFVAYADENMVVTRIGGDEYLVIIPNKSLAQVEQFIKNVQLKMAESDHNLPFSPIRISIGYEYSDSSYGVMDQLFSKADFHMYEQKKTGKML